MPAHLKQNEYGYWYLIDGFLNKSLKTKTKRYAEAQLRQYLDREFNLEPIPTVQKFYDSWIARKIPPLVRRSQVRDYKQHFMAYILPRFGDTVLSDIGPKELKDFQVELIQKGHRERRKPLSVKTVRCIIDSSFRAMYRDARVEIGKTLEGRDPFIDVAWPKVQRKLPDPFTIAEKERILEGFLEHEPYFYPYVRFQFETGARPSETAALTHADIDSEARTVRITKSRYMGEDNDNPKTTKSGRTITISRSLTDLIETLRHPWSKDSDKIFLNKQGGPLNPSYFRLDYWDRVLDSLEMRKRKFYATRHTFITDMVTKGYNLKAIGDYVGTSVAMIEQHYSAKLELDPDQEKTTDREVFEKYLSKSLKGLASPTRFELVSPA